VRGVFPHQHPDPLAGKENPVTTFICTDVDLFGDCPPRHPEVEVEAETPEAAAQQFVYRFTWPYDKDDDLWYLDVRVDTVDDPPEDEDDVLIVRIEQ
jgi:hypothetical protein